MDDVVHLQEKLQEDTMQQVRHPGKSDVWADAVLKWHVVGSKNQCDLGT